MHGLNGRCWKDSISPFGTRSECFTFYVRHSVASTQSVHLPSPLCRCGETRVYMRPEGSFVYLKTLMRLITTRQSWFPALFSSIWYFSVRRQTGLGSGAKKEEQKKEEEEINSWYYLVLFLWWHSTAVYRQLVACCCVSARKWLGFDYAVTVE